MRLTPAAIIGPIFWITVTYFVMTYKNAILTSVTGKTPPSSDSVSTTIGNNDNPTSAVLGETAPANNPAAVKPSPNISTTLPQTPQEIPQYIQKVTENIVTTVIERTREQVDDTRFDVTSSVCMQIMTEIQKQCGDASSL